MKINSKPFGEIEIDEKEILNFPEGILGFEGYNQYIILRESDDAAFFWLQSLDDTDLAFVVINPLDVIEDYSPFVNDESLEIIEQPKEDEVGIICIVTIPQDDPDKMSVNLQGPILVHKEKKLAAQFISDNENHHVRTPLLELLTEGADNASSIEKE